MRGAAGDLSHEHAWSESAARALGSGGILILYALRDGNSRPSDITDASGVIHPTLDRKADQLVLAGLIGRRKLPVAKNREWHEYYLTGLGLEVATFFETKETAIRKAAVDAATKGKGPIDRFQNQQANQPQDEQPGQQRDQKPGNKPSRPPDKNDD